MPTKIIIDASNFTDHAGDWNGHKRGCIRRDFSRHPKGSFTAAPIMDIKLIPSSEWKNRLDDQKGKKSSLSDIRDRGNFGQRIPSLDQDGLSFCWGHSGTSAIINLRAKQNLPYVRMSAFSICCPIKNFKDEGGMGIDGVKYIHDNGIADVAAWPEKSMDHSLLNKPEVAASRKLNHYTKFGDLPRRNGKIDMRYVVTCLLLNIPLVLDFNWWSHSVEGICLDTVHPEDETADIDIWNSWTDAWSAFGVGTIKGAHAVPDDAVAVLGDYATAA